MVIITKKKSSEKTETGQEELQWDNPANPEKAGDERDIEQLRRQKKDVEQKNENLNDKNLRK